MGKRQHHKHIFDNPNRKQIKSGEKEKKLIKSYKKLLRKEWNSGLTKWIENAKMKAQKRMVKYGIKASDLEKEVK